MNSGRLIRPDDRLDDMEWRADVSTTSFLRLQGTGGNVQQFFHFLNSNTTRLQSYLNERGTDLTIRLAESQEGEHRLSLHPRVLKKRVRLPSLDKEDQQRVEALRWMEIQFEDVRERVIEQWGKFQKRSDDELDRPLPSSPNDRPIAPDAELHHGN